MSAREMFYLPQNNIEDGMAIIVIGTMIRQSKDFKEEKNNVKQFSIILLSDLYFFYIEYNLKNLLKSS
jgi:hypothetical protein